MNFICLAKLSIIFWEGCPHGGGELFTALGQCSVLWLYVAIGMCNFLTGTLLPRELLAGDSHKVSNQDVQPLEQNNTSGELF